MNRFPQSFLRPVAPSMRESSHPNADVRMRGFACRVAVDVAIDWVDGLATPLGAETAELLEAHGRVLVEAIRSAVDVPGFDRAMMDGYAVRASDTSGATPSNQRTLAVAGEALPARPFEGHVEPGCAVRIMTGAPIPSGADAVLPAEKTEADGDHVLIHGEVASTKHFGIRGEDIAAGTIVLEAGRRLRPQDLGVLSSIGVSHLAVVRQPRVRIVATGDELLPAGTRPEGFQITDANSPMLAALVARDGGLPLGPNLVADDPDAILAALRSPADVTLVSGGSSVGQEDHVPQLLAEHGELAIHGVAMRPSSPTGMGRLQDQLVFLLPGNPVSCLCAYDFFAGRAIRGLGGRTVDWPYAQQSCRLNRKLVSVIGRTDYARVTVANGSAEPLAIAGASILSSTTRADGFVIIPADSEGYPAGTEVDVYRYDAQR
jgi:molybdopterin molybdotransferase